MADKITRCEKVKRVVSLWLPSLFWMAVIFVLSSLPGADFSSDGSANFWIRKALHIAEYTLLCVTYFRATKNAFLSIIFAIFYAAFDEVHQSFVPTRTGKISDFLIDSSGILVTGLLLWKYLPVLPGKLKTWLLE
ncbi:MAG: VanZ family protein [Patescibacteria group bacterium]